MKNSLLRATEVGLAFVLLIWALGQMQSFAATAEMILLPGIWLMQFVTPGGVHSDFLGEFSGYIALSMAFIFYAVVFGIILEVLRRHKDRRAAGQV